MKNKILFISISILTLFVWSSCSEPPTSVLDTQQTNSALSKTVYVPGSDITEQLRNDLNAGLDVDIPAGTFYLSESIVVFDYSGTIQGAGIDATVIENNPNVKFKALEDPLFPGFEHSEFMSLYLLKGDVTIKNMTFLVTGDAPAEEHNNIFDGSLTTIDNVIVVDGANEEAPASGITATFKNLKIKGEHSNDPLSYNGKNLVYPLIATGWDGVATKPVNTVMTDCVIENFGYAVEFFLNNGGTTLIQDNVIENFFGNAIVLNNIIGGSTLIQDNVIDAGGGEPAWGHISALRVNDVVFRNNHISGNSNWGVNPYNGSDGWLIEHNTFENISTTFGSITCDTGIKDAIIRNNKFVNATSTATPYAYGLISIFSNGSWTTVKNNNYNHSGVPGWPSGAGCILLWFDSSDYTILDHNYPAGTTMCEQILDFGVNNNMPPGWQGVCNPIPENVRQNYLTHKPKLPKKIRE